MTVHRQQSAMPCVVEAQLGVAYLRRGAWAAFLSTGACVGMFETAREACAALGGAK